MLDAMAINKADGDNRLEADRARVQYAGALHLFPASPDGWTPRVLTCSALANEGIREIWEMVLQHHEKMRASGWFLRRRRQQALAWMRELVLAGLEEEFFAPSRARTACPRSKKPCALRRPRRSPPPRVAGAVSQSPRPHPNDAAPG